MPFQSGVFRRLYSWVSDAAAFKTISAVEFDADGDDVAAALSNCILRDGQGAPTSDIPFAGRTLTNIRAAAALGEAVEYGQFQTGLAGAASVNLLDNATFGVNQRALSGTVGLTSGTYGHDRWKAGAGCTYTFGSSAPDTQVSIATGSLLQIVPGSKVDGGAYTLSHAGTAPARVYQSGSPPSYQSCPFTVTGLTAGVPIIVEFSAGTILRPQLEIGASAHSFRRQSPPLDTITCQAFYEVMTADFLAYSATATLRVLFRYRAPKIAMPSVMFTPSSNPFSNTYAINSATLDGFSLYVGGPGNFAGISGSISASAEP